jgi:hypothetical protein
MPCGDEQLVLMPGLSRLALGPDGQHRVHGFDVGADELLQGVDDDPPSPDPRPRGTGSCAVTLGHPASCQQRPATHLGRSAPRTSVMGASPARVACPCRWVVRSRPAAGSARHAGGEVCFMAFSAGADFHSMACTARSSWDRGAEDPGLLAHAEGLPVQHPCPRSTSTPRLDLGQRRCDRVRGGSTARRRRGCGSACRQSDTCRDIGVVASLCDQRQHATLPVAEFRDNPPKRPASPSCTWPSTRHGEPSTT